MTEQRKPQVGEQWRGEYSGILYMITGERIKRTGRYPVEWTSQNGQTKEGFVDSADLRFVASAGDVTALSIFEQARHRAKLASDELDAARWDRCDPVRLAKARDEAIEAFQALTDAVSNLYWEEPTP